MSRPLPAPIFEDANLRLFDLDWLASGRARGSTGPEGREPTLFGFRLPPFQRGSVWSDDQMVRFVESVVLEIDIGRWTLNDATEHSRDEDGVVVWPETHHWVVDGQQRITALHRFLSDELVIFQGFRGEDGFRWSDLDAVQKRRFLRTQFPVYVTQERDPNLLLELYDRLNFGGTPHRPEDRIEAEPVEMADFSLRR